MQTKAAYKFKGQNWSNVYSVSSSGFDAEVMPEKVSILFGAENWTQTVEGENTRTNGNRSVRVVSV